MQNWCLETKNIKIKTGGSSQIINNRDTLRHLMSIEFKITNVAKIFNEGRNLVSCFIKFHGLTDVLRDPEDDN